MKPLRLVWNNTVALDREAVRLACVGSTEELEAHLKMRRRRYPLQAVRSTRGATWCRDSDVAAVVVIADPTVTRTPE